MITFLQKFALNMAELTKPMRQLLRRELSGIMLDSRSRGHRFEPHQRHCAVSLSKNINPSLVLVQPRKTRPFITERLLIGRKASNQLKSNKQLLRKDVDFVWEQSQQNVFDKIKDVITKEPVLAYF